DDFERRADACNLESGDTLVLIGETAGHLGQSMLLREAFAREDGAPPKVDLALEKKVGDFVRGLIAGGLTSTCHDCSDGGLGVAVAEMALAANVGVSLGYQGDLADAAFLFGEDQARYLVALAPAQLEELEARAKAAGVSFLVVGEAGGRELSYLGKGGRDRIALDELRRLHEGWLPAYMKAS
ncbi:MAG: AIR synthase-related protein, partial [Hyphomonadaceae bacterium]|nr:AIR synthase-related protein [Hyphomonadaceae bacterium]